MVLKVLTDARQRMVHGNTMGLQLIRRADARELQQLRRSNRTCRKNDFSVSIDLLALFLLYKGSIR